MKPFLFNERIKEKIQTNLLQWFKENQRDLPWRKTKDPYAIWVSEIMLQQTQVQTVIPYYQRFLNTFPNLRSLAKAPLSKVLKVWEGLGYYSRARNLHLASQIILNHFDGKVPDRLENLLRLPGVGQSTAGAILSIAFNKEAPILDGNVKRVLSRLLAVSKDQRKERIENLLWQIAQSLIPKGHADSFNQALMDLGAMICTPKNPHCQDCPLMKLCQGFRSGAPENYSIFSPEKRIPHFFGIAAIIQKNKKVLLVQRPLKGFLGGLWEFPNWKIGSNERRLRMRLRNRVKKELGIEVTVKNELGTFSQTYSHFRLTLQVFSCEYLHGNGKGRWVSIKTLDQFPMSRLHREISNLI